VVGVVGIAGVWANRQLLDTGRWVATSDRMLHNGEVRGRVSRFLAEELIAAVREQVGGAGGKLSANEEALLEARSAGLARRALVSRPIETVWRQANRSAHRSLLRILDEEGSAAGDTPVVLDLDPALRHLASELSYGELQASPPPPGAGRIVVVRESELGTAQTVVGAIRHVPLIAGVLLLVLFGLVLALASSLWRGLGAIGLSLILIGALALIVRVVAGDQIVDALTAERSVRAAADAAWGIASSTVVTLSVWSLVIGGVLVLAAGLLGRRSRFA
jgi:hypothetical protein